MQDDARAKSWPSSSFPPRPLSAILLAETTCSAATACHSRSTATTVAIFVRNDDFWTVEEQLAGKRQPQFGRALEQLGVTFIAANSTGQRPRRAPLGGAAGSLVQRTPPAAAHDIDSANAACASSSPTTTGVSPKSPASWKPLGAKLPDSLDRICCFVHESVVSNDNVVQWEGSRFQIPQQARRFSFAGARVRIYQALDGRVSLYYGGTSLEHSSLPGGYILCALG